MDENETMQSETNDTAALECNLSALAGLWPEIDEANGTAAGHVQE